MKTVSEVRSRLGPVKPHPSERLAALGTRVQNAVFRAKLDAQAEAIVDDSKHWSIDRDAWDFLLNEKTIERLAEVGVSLTVIPEGTS